MEVLPIINKTYEIYKNIIEINTKLEKRWRYGIGLRLENTVLDCVEVFVMAKSAPKTLKASYLLKGLGKLELTMLQLRLMLELKLANETRLFQIQAKLAEVGRMLGGWIKSVQT